MVLTVVTGHRLEALFDALVARLTAVPAGPMERHTVLVPGQGIARWLELRLAERLGIAAGIDTPFLGAFLHGLGDDRFGGDADPFSREVLAFRIWRLLDAQPQRFGAAGDYFAAGGATGDDVARKRLQLSRRLAACLDDYQLYRDDLLRAFAAGDDQAKLSPHAPWQAELWRALLEDAGVAPSRPARRRRRSSDERTPLLFAELADDEDEPPRTSPAHRLDHLRQQLDDDEWCRARLPRALDVFGPTTMPPAFVDVLRRMARRVDIGLFVPQPTPHYVGDLRGRGPAPGENALLQRFGAESREFADVLIDLEDTAGEHAEVTRVDLTAAADDDADAAPDTLLACIQRDVTNAYDRGGRDATRFALREGDDSVRVHDCHGPLRELEVVRDQICRAFDRDPSLEPRDVLVLVPDIDRYAPYAHAVFGPLQHLLPFHVADRHPARELPVCRALLDALDLARSRLTLDDVLHLLETPAVQRRFGLFATDVPALRHLCNEAGIRWGLDGQSRRERFDLPAFDDNAWRPGLDRLVLGALTGPVERLVLDRAPVGDTTESRVELLARFTTFARALFAHLDALRDPAPFEVWADRLDALTAALFAADAQPDQDAVQRLQRAAVALRGQARSAGHTEAVPLAVLRDWLDDHLGQGAPSRGFLGGAITIAAMLPMRAVPVRSLFVCGLDDESFPRRDHPSPFDLISARPRPGDRNRRLDDRQLFLDLLLAARERLHLTFVGHSAKDNAECAPSVVLSELLDLLDRTCRGPDGARPRDVVTVTHPLQPWSERYRGDDPRLFTYGPVPRRSNNARADAPWCPSELTLPADPSLGADDELELDDLLHFWWHPCRAFLRERLRVRVRNSDEGRAEHEPFGVDPLLRYALQEEAIRHARHADGRDADPLAWTRARGLLPVGAHGDVAFHHLQQESDHLLHAGQQLARAAVRRLDVTLDVDGAPVRVHGELDGFTDGELVYLRSSRIKGKDRLRAWLQHLVVTLQRAADGDRADPPWPTRTRVVSGDGVRAFLDVPRDDAARYLAHMVRWYRVGLTRPLPSFEQSSTRAVEVLAKRDDPAGALRAAANQFEVRNPDEAYRFDLNDADVALCMRDRDPFEGGERGDFLRLVREVWLPAFDYLKKEG